MNYVQKANNIIRTEGLDGLGKRLRLRLDQMGNQNPVTDVGDQNLVIEVGDQNLDAEVDAVKKDYQQQADSFKQYAISTNFPGSENFYWYHSIELDNGIITPGDYDYRNSLEGFHFPDDMTGMRVLDIGSATGFFAFEFERRGASVVSVELPSLTEWDMIHNEKENILKGMMYFHQTTTPQDAYYRHLKGPFEFCQTQKQSSIKRVYSSIYNLHSHLTENETFDIVFLGDILLHLFSPFAALNIVAPFCKSNLIIATDLFGLHADIPLMEFLGTKSKGKDFRTWWTFNDNCIEEMLFRVGFSDVKLMGDYSGIMRRTWSRYHRYVFHATK